MAYFLSISISSSSICVLFSTMFIQVFSDREVVCIIFLFLRKMKLLFSSSFYITNIATFVRVFSTLLDAFKSVRFDFMIKVNWENITGMGWKLKKLLRGYLNNCSLIFAYEHSIDIPIHAFRHTLNIILITSLYLLLVDINVIPKRM